MKGGRTALASGVHHIRSRAYRKRNKLHVKPTGWNIWGNIEVKEIMQVLKLMVEGEEGDKIKYSVNTHTQHGTMTSVGIR